MSKNKKKQKEIKKQETPKAKIVIKDFENFPFSIQSFFFIMTMASLGKFCSKTFPCGFFSFGMTRPSFAFFVLVTTPKGCFFFFIFFFLKVVFS
jgi:hypothetical protein